MSVDGGTYFSEISSHKTAPELYQPVVMFPSNNVRNVPLVLLGLKHSSKYRFSHLITYLSKRTTCEQQSTRQRERHNSCTCLCERLNNWTDWNRTGNSGRVWSVHCAIETQRWRRHQWLTCFGAIALSGRRLRRSAVLKMFLQFGFQWNFSASAINYLIFDEFWFEMSFYNSPHRFDKCQSNRLWNIKAIINALALSLTNDSTQQFENRCRTTDRENKKT